MAYNCVRLTYQHSVINAEKFRTAEENLRLAKMALIALLGRNIFVPNDAYNGKSEFEEFGGTVDYYGVKGG